MPGLGRAGLELAAGTGDVVERTGGAVHFWYRLREAVDGGIESSSMSLPRMGALYKADEIIDGLGEGSSRSCNRPRASSRVAFNFLLSGILGSGHLSVQGLNLLNCFPPYLVISIL